MLRHILTFILLSTVASAAAQKTISLYRDTVPNSLASSNKEYSKGEDLQIFNVTNPTLTVHLPARRSTATSAVIICPGGGYGSLYINREGNDMAKAFAARGVAAFVLKYRLPDPSAMRDPSIAPLQDAQQAIKIIRERAAEYNVNPSMIGIMGFSAGGHLAASAGILHEQHVIANKKNTNLRPDFMILVYPVITMDTTIGHKGSTFNLLGRSPNSEQLKRFSLELQVNKNTPPAYITVARDDDMLASSMLACAAFESNDIVFESHIYSSGGHGFLKYPSFSDWTRVLFEWMQKNDWISK